MPQVIVDTATETPASLVLLSRLFQDYAMLKAKQEQQAAAEYPAREADAPLGDSNAEGTLALLEQDPAKLFAKAPAAIPVAPVTATLVPPVQTTAQTSALPATTTPVAGAPATAATGPDASGATVAQTAEVDAANVPWDARIHSSAKGKKQDGTWKLMRGVDKSLVTMVLHEITPRPHVVNGQIVPAGTAAPVVPPVTVPAAPVAPVPAVPVAPAAGVVPVGGAEIPLNPVQQFQALMKLIAEGQSSSPPKFSHADVLAACVAEGLAQVQLIITAPEKIPAIKARLGLV